MVNTGALSVEILGMTLSKEINLGNILTICSIVPGFFWWLYTNHRQLERQKVKDAESGSLRVLLSILRELKGQPIKISELKEKYNSPQLAPTRKAYCGFDFYLHDINEFEKSVYALDWEGKIDFVGTEHIKFRVDTTDEQLKLEEQRLEEDKARRELEQLRLLQEEKRVASVFEATKEDIQNALDAFKSAMMDRSFDEWKLEKLARTAQLLDIEKTSAIVRTASQSDDAMLKNRALTVMGRLLAPY